MDCVETAVMRKAGLRGEMVMFPPSTAAAVPGHGQPQLQYLQSPFSSSLPEEAPAPAACAPVDRSGLLWEDFSVDDLLDFGGGKEQNGEEEEEEEEEEQRKDSPTDLNASSSSVLSFQALLPSTEPIVPAGDVADLEWVSRFVDDSYSEFHLAVVPPLQNHHAPTPVPQEAAWEAPATKPHSTSASTISSKRTWGSCCFSTDSLVVPAKARSKRSRTGGRVWSLCLPPLLAESSSSSCSSGSSSSSCTASSSISSCLLYEKLDSGGGVNPHRILDCAVPGRRPFNVQHVPAQLQLKKKGRKPKALVGVAAAADGSGGNGGEPQTRRRCSHCGVDKTPQWRAGPLGAKTLCNACGVRYKSGRLLPEYRPAGSPTFLSHMHSNSHRKVLEMRRKKEVLATAVPAGPASCSPLAPPPPAVASQPYGVV